MATEEDYKKRLLEIRSQIGNIDAQISTLFIEKEIKKLPEILDQDENIIHAVTGNYDGTKHGFLVATNKRLIFLAYGMFSSFEDKITYDRVKSVRGYEGIVYVDITIFTTEKNIEIKNCTTRKNALNFCNTVNNYLAKLNDQPKNVSHHQNSEPETNDIMEQLKKLGELREKGILTDNEFTEQKKKLLDKL